MMMTTTRVWPVKRHDVVVAPAAVVVVIAMVFPACPNSRLLFLDILPSSTRKLQAVTVKEANPVVVEPCLMMTTMLLNSPEDVVVQVLPISSNPLDKWNRLPSMTTCHHFRLVLQPRILTRRRRKSPFETFFLDCDDVPAALPLLPRPPVHLRRCNRPRVHWMGTWRIPPCRNLPFTAGAILPWCLPVNQ